MNHLQKSLPPRLTKRDLNTNKHKTDQKKTQNQIQRKFISVDTGLTNISSDSDSDSELNLERLQILR